MNFKIKNYKLTKNLKLKIKNFQYGYTLIEILVVLTIIGILFSVGYANFRGFSQRQVVIDTAKEIQGDIRLTQQMALSGQLPDDLKCTTPNTLNGYNFNVLSTSEYQIQANCTGGIVISKDVNLPSGILLSTPSPNPVIFNILGNGTSITSGQNATIVITQTGTTNKSTITISSGGEIQ
jgi:prepilin-type N-terminal cleavage/methylation domain-containing protein